MDAFLDFFAVMPSWQKLLWVAIVLSFCWLLELAIPMFEFGYKKWRHARVNLTFLVFSMLINLAFSIGIVLVVDWSAAMHFGLLNLVDMPVWAGFLITVVILDFTAQYFAHYLLHKLPFLFRFHMVHHSDTKVDATTATRHHPGDYVFREVLSLAVVFLVGAPVEYYIFYRMLTIFFGYTSHANILFPRWLDRTLGWLVITPNMHKFHHHEEVHWTDSNYGNILSVWDRIFGTLVVDDPKKVVYGLDVVDGKFDEDLLYQLYLPLNRDVKTLSQRKAKAVT
ncbi:MAG: sterol desaturase family protein [Spongiibacteraceae bacterium]